MYNSFVWDFDGTLFDTYPAMVNLLKEMLESEGYMPSEERLMREMKSSMGHALDYCRSTFGVSEAFIQSYGQRRERYDVTHSQPYPYALAVCKAIFDSGKLNFLYTHRGDNAIEMMAIHGLLPYFKESLTTAYSFKRKPDPEGMHYLIAKYSLKPKEILMIGDRDLDILAGKNAGTDACFINELGLKHVSADINISSLDALLKWV